MRVLATIAVLMVIFLAFFDLVYMFAGPTGMVVAATVLTYVFSFIAILPHSSCLRGRAALLVVALMAAPPTAVIYLIASSASSHGIVDPITAINEASEALARCANETGDVLACMYSGNSGGADWFYFFAMLFIVAYLSIIPIEIGSRLRCER